MASNDYQIDDAASIDPNIGVKHWEDNLNLVTNLCFVRLGKILDVYVECLLIYNTSVRL